MRPAPERPGETHRLTEVSRDRSTDQRPGEAGHETGRLGQWYTIREAAELLGTTVDGARGRIRRGTLDSMKVDGQVYVLLDAPDLERRAGNSTLGRGDELQQTAEKSQLVTSLEERISAHQDQIEWLRREVERKDMIIMQMAQRIPELEPAPDPRGSSETGPQDADRGEEAPLETSRRRSWLRRFFFGP